MRPRASQVARTEEDVETYRPALDALKTTIGDRQEELAVDEDDGLSVSVRWPDRPHPPVRGGRCKEQGEVQFSTSPKLSCSLSTTYIYMGVRGVCICT